VIDPPADIAAEQQLIGALLLSPDCVDEVTDIVTPGDCYRMAHELIFRAVLDQREAGEPVDMMLISERLRTAGELKRVGGASYLADLTINLITASSASYYAAIVARCASQRALMRAAQRIMQMATAEDIGEISDVQARARQEVDEAIFSRSRDQVVWLGDALRDTLEVLSSPPDLLNTRWSDLDQIIGGVAPGRLYVIGARPSVGKTAMALQWAKHHAQVHGQAALFFTLEMARREIMIRLLSQGARVGYSDLERHAISESDWTAIEKEYGALLKLPLMVVDRPHVRIGDIRRISRSVARTWPLGMIVVDYLQLMGHHDSRLPRNQQVAEFSRSLKLLARELEVPVVALSQLNRASENRTSRMPGLHDLRDSGAVEQDADVVILLNRDTEEMDRRYDLLVNVAKNRYGPPGQIHMRFDGHYQRIEQGARQGDIEPL